MLEMRGLATCLGLIAGVFGALSTAVAQPPAAPVRLVTRAGDRSVALHWDRPPSGQAGGYQVYRAFQPEGPFALITRPAVALLSFADMDVTNGQTYHYLVRATNSAGQSPASEAATATPQPFASNKDFLDLLQQTAFDYFWYEANPTNGLVRDRSRPDSFCSIAATGFGLTALGIGIDRGWITRDQGRDRTLATLRTFWEKPKGPNSTGVIGYKGWFYHFLDMNTAARYANSELSSIDTALLLAGVLYARQYFNQDEPREAQIRTLAEAIFNQVDWSWMTTSGQLLSHGWMPGTGFLFYAWTGYCEAMLLYVLGLGANTNPVPPVHWTNWTKTYKWQTYYGYSFVNFAPLFGHQYSHCWIDFRYLTDAYMRAKGITYFENSRRATLAQRQYAIANPSRFPAYGSNVWGLTACDGPGTGGLLGYAARGTPPPLNDDGTIAPTAAGGSLAFTPELSLAALRFMYETYRSNIWTGYGFRDAFNRRVNWWDPDVLGIDQGPILLMAENYRTKGVWRVFMKNPEIQRGLDRAGFTSLAFAQPALHRAPVSGEITVSWAARLGSSYQVEYSPSLANWFHSFTGFLSPTNGSGFLAWQDIGPPATDTRPTESRQRFYRVVDLGGSR
jgi:hypothetical protein